MSAELRAVLRAIDRWEQGTLIDRDTGQRLRDEAAEASGVTTKRLSQYLLAGTGAVVLLLAGGLFLSWTWPLLSEAVRTGVLVAVGVLLTALGIRFEGQHRWLPASLLLQAAGLGFVLVAVMYSQEAWQDMTTGAIAVGAVGLAMPLVLAPRAIRSNVVMPAVLLAFWLAFLGLFLARATRMSETDALWVVDGALVVAIVAFSRILLSDPRGERHPWALNAFVTGLFAGFILVITTATGPLNMGSEAMYPLDVWWLMVVAVTLWGLHAGPVRVQREDFGRMLAGLMLLWIPLGFITALETLDGAEHLALTLVGGVGVVGFWHAMRFELGALMGAAALAFISALWFWSVERAGALGAVFALAATAGILFWMSSRAGADDDQPMDEGTSG